ncbi:MAG: IPT/TIG domain-containing protein [Planctomycetes bacterium]|nr:IPT/TIG domain-containing protein [Planctomycetota bacterium]
MRPRRLLVGLLALAAFAGAIVTAHVRLIHPGNGKSLRWGRPQDVSIVLSSMGSDDVHDGSHLSALRNAIDAWNDVPGAAIHLHENTSPAQMQRTDWASDSIHLVTFDEDDSSGYFPGGSGTVALTPVWFSNNGIVTDADILFNGADFTFTTSGEPGAFDVQDVAAHELGHFVGLDHSGWAGATMFPYVDPTVVLHRSLSADEEHGLRDAYPSDVRAVLTGIVRRASNDLVVAGAHVVARDAEGRTRASALTNTLGAFTLRGLDAGDYELYAVPLDQPVSESNLTNGHTVSIDFASTILGTYHVDAGEELSIGTQHVDPDVTLSLGRNYDVYPLRAIAGQTRSYQVRGSGLVAGCTLTASDPDFVVNATSWMSSQVNFQVTVPAGEAPGHVDLVVENVAGERSILPAALEVTPRDPVVDSIAPALATSSGGTVLVLSGSRFQPGSRVVLGSEVYVDGEADGCVVVDASTITLATRATPGGTYDVVVIDPTGVEGRLDDAFQFALVPAIESVFPPSGSAAGGTLITVTGSDFEDGVTVAIDGVVQTIVTRESSTTLRILTNAYPAGGPYVLDVQNPSGPSASAAFAYSAAPDPAITALDPAEGSASGGEEIVVHGANFEPSTVVEFGADPDTGSGGTPAPSVTYVDANTLVVVTPAHSGGAQSVLVRDGASGQAAVLPSAYMFRSSGGGGGCSIAPVGRPSGGDPLREAALGLAWIALAFSVAWARTRRLERARR